LQLQCDGPLPTFTFYFNLRRYTMDAAADGYVRGEALGILLLEARTAAALHGHSAGAAALPTIVSTAVNQDGRSSGLTAPSGLSQQAVIRLALTAGGLSPEHLQMLQMHGTGTPLGDPIEFGASLAALKRDTGAPLMLEAVKSYIGHTECASGIIGLMQPLEHLVTMKSAQVLHLSTVNPHVTSVLDSAKYAATLVHVVGRCSFQYQKPLLKAPMFSALANCNIIQVFQPLVSNSSCGDTARGGRAARRRWCRRAAGSGAAWAASRSRARTGRR
jgi:hypothetical protein